MRIAIIFLAIIGVFALLAPLFLPWDHASIDWDYVSAGAGVNGHILGTDDVGRDVAARLAVATRITLAVALTAAAVSLVIGVVWGAAAGWIGGKVDEFMMRIVDALFALPFMFVVIILMVVFGRSIILVFVGIGLVEWLTMARIVRGQVLTLKNRPYVMAARGAGAPAITILARHILPNIAGIALAYLVLTLPQLVMIESFLSFLGLGVQEPLVSLGMLIKDGAEVMDIQPLALLLPGGIMVTLLVALTLIGDRLRDHFA